MTPEEIEAVLQGQDGGAAGHGKPAPSDEQQKVKWSQEVFTELEKLWVARDASIKLYAEKLAIGSRKGSSLQS